MESMLSQHRDLHNYAGSPYRPGHIQDSFPRSFQQPLAMESPITSGHFTVWPPTPSTEERRLSKQYPFTMSEPARHSTASWDEHDSRPSGVNIPSSHHHHYSSQIDNHEEWLHSADYLLGGIDTTEGSSYGSSNGYLPVPYHYTAHPEVSLRLNTNIDSWRPSEDNSADPTTASTPAYYETEGSYINGYRTPLTISATSTPLSPSLSSLSRYGGRDSISPLTKQYRAKPYTTRSEKKRWSQGSSYYGLNVDPQLQPQFHSPQVSPVSAPTIQRPIQQAYLPPHQQSLPRGTGNYIPEHYERSQITPLVASPYIPSHCHPNHHHSSHYSEYSERPNLFSCLTEEQIPPPEADMNPEDPDMIPHEQALRFEGDLYTPRWVRGHGASREGWCGICKPGRWLVLKNSAFWYDKSFSHGVSAATCLPFNGPREMRRMDGNPDVWEGLCHQCNDWMPLVSNKKKGTTWYRHAYKCHTHNKVRDAPKRRREGKSRAKAESR